MFQFNYNARDLKEKREKRESLKRSEFSIFFKHFCDLCKIFVSQFRCTFANRYVDRMLKLRKFAARIFFVSRYEVSFLCNMLWITNRRTVGRYSLDIIDKIDKCGMQASIYMAILRIFL